jgi:hypothetical protein
MQNLECYINPLNNKFIEKPLTMNYLNQCSYDLSKEIIYYAYDVANPLIYKKSNVFINSYSLNFMWIHNTYPNFNNNCHMFGNNENDFFSNLIHPIKSWSNKQPHAIINYWYDGNMINDIIIDNTKLKLINMNVNLNNVHFCNIRNIDLININNGIFNDIIPIYWKVDLLKLIILNHELQTKDYAITIDLDFIAISHDHLFDDKTIHELNDIGVVFGSAKLAEEENGFIMMHKYNEHVMEWNLKTINMAFKFVKNNKYFGQQDIFLLQKEMKKMLHYIYIKKHNHKWNYYGIKRFGKAMIFPPSQFNNLNQIIPHNGYNNHEIDVLKNIINNNFNNNFNKN